MIVQQYGITTQLCVVVCLSDRNVVESWNVFLNRISPSLRTRYVQYVRTAAASCVQRILLKLQCSHPWQLKQRNDAHPYSFQSTLLSCNARIRGSSSSKILS